MEVCRDLLTKISISALDKTADVRGSAKTALANDPGRGQKNPSRALLGDAMIHSCRLPPAGKWTSRF